MTVRIFAVAVGSMALLFAGAGPGVALAGDGDTLLAKHREFVGWQAGDGTLKTWRQTLKHVVIQKNNAAGEPRPPIVFTLTEVRRGSVYRETITREGPGLVRDAGFTGRVFWDADYNGNVVTHLEERAQADLSSNAVFNDVVSALPGTMRGTGKVGSDSYQIVRVVPPQGLPVDLYVDSNGAYHRAVINPDRKDRSETIDIDKYIEFAPGKKTIGAYHVGSGTIYEVQKIEANVAVSDDEIRPPAQRSTWTFGSGEPSPIEIRTYTQPYGDSVGRAVVMKASVNGRQGTFLLDSGAYTIILFSPFADNLGLDSLAPTAYSGVSGGSVGGDLVRVKDLTIGSNVLHNVIVTKSRGKSLLELDGILGYDFLANALVDVDLVGLKLTILDPKQFAPTVEKTAYAFPVDLTTRHAAVHITVGNGVDANPDFDTGASFSVLLSDSLLRSGKIVPLTSTITLSNGMVVEQRTFLGGVDGSGAELEPCSRIGRMQIGPFRYENAPLCFGSGRVFGDNGGLIGFDFLRHFNWTFDYPDGKLVLTPNGAAN
jgi:hypothetical protein